MRDKQREETRQRLYLASLEVFEKDGVVNARIEDIARRAEVSRAAFYFHFPSKDAVLLQLLQEAEDVTLKELVDLPAEPTLKQVLDGVSRALARFWSERRALIPDAYGCQLRYLASPEGIGAFPSRRRVAELFRSLQQRGLIIREAHIEGLAESFLMTGMNVLIGWCRAPQLPLEQRLLMAAHHFSRAARPE